MDRISGILKMHEDEENKINTGSNKKA